MIRPWQRTSSELEKYSKKCRHSKLIKYHDPPHTRWHFCASCCVSFEHVNGKLKRTADTQVYPELVRSVLLGFNNEHGDKKVV